MSVKNETPKGLEAVKIVRDFLTERGLSPKEEPFEHGVVFRVTFDGPTDQGIAQVHVDIQRFAFVFMFPGFVPPERRLQVAEFMTRVNWGLIEGSFEMNYDTGAFAYRTGIDFSLNGLTDVLVRNMLLSGMDNIESYFNELLDVVEGRIEPKAAALAARSRLSQ